MSLLLIAFWHFKGILGCSRPGAICHVYGNSLLELVE